MVVSSSCAGADWARAGPPTQTSAATLKVASECRRWEILLLMISRLLLKQESLHEGARSLPNAGARPQRAPTQELGGVYRIACIGKSTCPREFRHTDTAGRKSVRCGGEYLEQNCSPWRASAGKVATA